MEIDANIPLAVKPPVIDSPLKTMSDIYTVKNQAEELKGRQLLNTQRDQENAQRTRAAADDAAIRTELQNSFDPTKGDIDYQGAINRLHQGGHGTAAIKLADDFSKRQQQHAATSEQELKRHAADLEIGSQVLAGVHKDDDPENDDARWQAAKAHFAGMKDMTPDTAAAIAKMPDDYKSAKPYIDLMVDEGTKTADRIREAHESLRDHMEAVKLGIVKPDPKKGEQEPQEVTENREKVRTLQTSSVGHMLGTATNDQQYQQMLQSFKSQQYPPEILNKFAPVYSPEAVAKAKALTMSEKDYEELGIQRTNAGANVTRANADLKRANDAVGATSKEDQKAYEDARNEYDKGHPISTKAMPQFDPTTHKFIGMGAPTRTPFPSMADWVKNGRQATPAAPQGPPAQIPIQAPMPPQIRTGGAPPPGAMPTPPPPVAAAPPVAPPQAPVAPPAVVSAPPAVAPGLRPMAPPPVMPPPPVARPVAPPVAATPPAAAGGVRIKLPDGPPYNGRTVRFKDKASADAFTKAAGLIAK